MDITTRYSKVESVSIRISKFDIMGWLIKDGRVPDGCRLTAMEFDEACELLTVQLENSKDIEP